MNIKDLDIKELKALAYDHLANIEQSQASLRMLNQEIASRKESPAPVEIKE